MDERAGRADEPDNQGSHRQAIPLRFARAAEVTSRRLYRGLQLRAPLKDTARADAVRVHHQAVDRTPRTV